MKLNGRIVDGDFLEPSESQGVKGQKAVDMMEVLMAGMLETIQ